LIGLIQGLGLQDTLHWSTCKTSYYHEDTLYPFSSPLDLLMFRPIPFSQRIKFGLNIVRSRYRRDWRSLDREPAKKWLISHIGSDAYSQIWEPLLKVKFGEHHEEISAAWIWHRINRVAQSRQRIWRGETFGYLEGGTETLIRRIMAELERRAVDVRLNTRVDRLVARDGRVVGVEIRGPEGLIECGRVVSTVPCPCLVQLLDGQWNESQSAAVKKLESISYLGVVCLLLHLRRPITDSFWVNINSTAIPFNGLIEYANLNRHFDGGRSHAAYIPFYVSTHDPRFTQSDADLLRECCAALKRIDPMFEDAWVLGSAVSRNGYAQPICTTGFADRIPSFRGPLDGIFVTDSCQLYPEDRTLSGMIRLGTGVGKVIAGELEGVR
jgi:protoporphyrinogen oxidase